MASKNKIFLYLIVTFLAFFIYCVSYNAKATVRRCTLCQCQYWGVKPYEVLKVYTAAEHLCIINICEKCAHADDEEDNNSIHSSIDNDKNDSDSTYSETSDDSVHDTIEITYDTHHTDPLHKNKILIIKTQIERILANIWNCDIIASHFKDAPDGIIYRGLTVRLITLAPVHLFRLTFCNSFYNQSTAPDVIEAIATSPYAQRQTFNSTDHFTIYHYNEEHSTEKDMKTRSESNITDHTNGDINKDIAEAIEITGLYSWHLTTPSHPHNLLQTPLATLLAIRDALENIVHTPYIAYQLLPCDQQKYVNHVTQHCTQYVQAWLKDLPSDQKKVTGLPDSRTLSESLASSLEYCFTGHPFRINVIHSKSLCTFQFPSQSSKKIFINDIIFYGNMLFIYQKNEQIFYFNEQKIIFWTLQISELPKLNVNTDCNSRLPKVEMTNSITNFMRNKNCCTINNDGTILLHQDLISYSYYLSVRDGQRYKQYRTLVPDQYDLCLAMSNECDQSFYICVQRNLAHTCYQADGQKNLYPPYQIRILRIKFTDTNIIQENSFSYIKRRSHPDASFNAYFNSIGNLLFLQSIVPAALSDAHDHLISVYEKKDNGWKLIVDNIPYQPYPQELLKPDDWDSASIVDFSGRRFLINEKFKQPYGLGVINGLTLYKKINNIWETGALPYNNQYALRNAQAHIQRVCFSRDGRRVTLLFKQQQSPLCKYYFCTWLIDNTQIYFINNNMINDIENTSCHFILNQEYPTIYSERNKKFFICTTTAADHTSPTQITVIEKNHLEYEEWMPHYVQPIAFSHDRKIGITCENTEDEAMLTIHRTSNQTVQRCSNNFDRMPIAFSIPNMVIYGMKMWTFDRYLVCWGLRITDQKSIVKIFSITPIVSDSEDTEIVKEATD